MRHSLFPIALSALLCGCVSSHSFYLMGRTTGVSGSGIQGPRAADALSGKLIRGAPQG